MIFSAAASPAKSPTRPPKDYGDTCNNTQIEFPATAGSGVVACVKRNSPVCGGGGGAKAQRMSRCKWLRQTPKDRPQSTPRAHRQRGDGRVADPDVTVGPPGDAQRGQAGMRTLGDLGVLGGRVGR